MFTKKRKVFVIGCSNMGAYIAGELSAMGDDVNIIDRDKRSFHILSDSYSGFKTIGDAMDREFLDSQNIQEADIALVATEDDNTNAFISQYLKLIYNLPIVITRIYDAEKNVILEGTGIKIIYPSILVANEFFNILENPETLLEVDDKKGE